MTKDITLQQGLKNFQTKNRKYFSERPMSPEGKAFLKCHDIAHVVFGCDTSLYGEGIVKIWTTFGTTLGFWKVVSSYNEVDAFELFKKYSFSHVVKNITRFLLKIPSTILRAKKMTKPWPFTEYKSYLDTPISEIRKEFNIKVI